MIKIFSATRKDFDVETFPAGGPGGQHQNRSNTAVRITHRATGLSATCREHRSQLRNKVTAFRRLAKLLVTHVLQKDARERATQETVRTYHAVDNRVKDHASGLQQPYDSVLDDPSDMIEARSTAKRG